ncbi:hypothetical protein DSO57_1029184 [Entomophthora muscae]|uniref:Uncharacterized protein n=1 Tax=Entomophthora muscae TaxID=34485 RepID=A0ACC2TN26_9FUNG|nr:hypothetical protein DSO57_1029184 [Entomophthora muscae]
MTSSARTLGFLKRYRPWTVAEEIPLTIAAVAFFLLSGFIVSIVNAFLDHENPFAFDSKRVVSYDPLLNLLHKWFVTLGLPKKLPDQLMPYAFPLSLIRIALGRKHSCLLLRRITWIMGVGYFIRIPFTLMTMLPNPNPDWHTIPFISTALIWVYNPVPFFPQTANILCATVVSIFSALSVLSLIAARYHYTLDCVLSASTMCILWKLYYFALSQPPNYWFYSLVQVLDGGSKYTRDSLLPTTEDAFQKYLLLSLPALGNRLLLNCSGFKVALEVNFRLSLGPRLASADVGGQAIVNLV